MIYDPKSLVNARVGINPASYTTAQNGAAIDTLGFEHAMVVMHFGALTDTAGLALKVQSSDTSGGTYADVTGATYSAVENADDNTIKVGIVRLHGQKRFIRVVSTVTNTDACVYGAQVILFTMDYEFQLRQTFQYEVL